VSTHSDPPTPLLATNNSKKMNRTKISGYLMVMTAAVLFGLNGSISRLLFNDGITPLTLIEFRMLIGGICLMAVLVIGQRKGLEVKRRYWWWVVVFGISLAFTTYTYFLAISRLPIAVALIIIFTAAAWMALWEAIWHKRMPSKHVLIALGLTFGGVILLTGIWRANLNGLDLLGLFFAFLGLFTYIAYLVLGRRIGRYLPSITSTGYGALVASLFWFIFQPPWTIPANTWTPYHLFLIALVGIIGMAIPFSLILGSLRRIDTMHVGIVSMLELPAAGIIAFFWLGQRLDFWQILGCVLVLAGVTILQYEKSEEVHPIE
jgi:drug/metabolite transporter (DMT)-like permease